MGDHKFTFLKTALFAGVLMLLNITLVATPVYATTINFTGTLEIIEIDNGSNRFSRLAVGDPFSGSVTYGNTAADGIVFLPSPTAAEYFFTGSPYGGSITSGSITTAGVNSGVGTGNDDGMGDDAPFINNLYGASSTTAGTIAGTWSVDIEANNVGFGLASYVLDTPRFATTDFQALPPALADSDFEVFYMAEGDEFDKPFYQAIGQLTSITVAPVPGIVNESDLTVYRHHI